MRSAVGIPEEEHEGVLRRGDGVRQGREPQAGGGAGEGPSI